MNDFEILPFANTAPALEQERGMRGHMPARAWPGRPRPLPHPRPGHGWPRGRAWYGGPYGPWPWDVVVAAPDWPDSAAPNGAWSGDGADFDADRAWRGEVPPTLQATIARLPAASRPPYIALGNLTAALADPRSNAPGLYVIEFTVDGRQRAYSGKSQNMRRRIQNHQLCAHILGLPVAGHQVYIAPMASLTPTQRRALERRIHTDMFANHPGVLTNQRRELEAEMLSNWR